MDNIAVTVTSVEIPGFDHSDSSTRNPLTRFPKAFTFDRPGFTSDISLEDEVPPQPSPGFITRIAGIEEAKRGTGKPIF